MHLLACLLTQNVIDKHEKPRNKPKYPPIAETKAPRCITKYCLLVSTTKSSNSNPKVMYGNLFASNLDT